jgi:hypothetical protein
MISLILAIIVIIVIYYCSSESYQDIGTHWDIEWTGPSSSNCYQNTAKNCLDYSNCGVCNGKCVPGDVQGAYFKQGCNTWKYNNYYDGRIYDKGITRLSRPWSHVLYFN